MFSPLSYFSVVFLFTKKQEGKEEKEGKEEQK
jgi:hypothetical protein